VADALIAQLVADVEALRDRVSALERQLRRQDDDDRDLVRAIVTAVHADVLFSAGDLVEHGTIDRALGQALGGLTARQLGKKLRELADRPLGGFAIVRVDRNSAGTIWMVQVCGDLHREPCRGGLEDGE